MLKNIILAGIFVVAMLMLLATVANAETTYYYYTSDSCKNCKTVTPLIEKSDTDFEVIENGKRLPVRSYPTVIIEVTGCKDIERLLETLNITDTTKIKIDGDLIKIRLF